MTPTLAFPPLLTQPLRDLRAWTTHFSRAPLPVLGETVAMIGLLHEKEDAVDAHMLAETVATDPLMTLKLMAHVAHLRPGRAATDTATVTAALLMLGIGPFFRSFDQLHGVEAHLAEHPRALAGLQLVLRRAHRAAAFALGFAVHRMDHDANLIHEAALLHDFAEMLLWIHAPALALRMAELQAADATLRSAAVQLELLNIELADLQQSLMKAWGLPELLVKISDDKQADSPQVRTVLLAVRLARHTAKGWDNPAFHDDLADIAELLNLGHEPARRLLRDIDG